MTCEKCGVTLEVGQWEKTVEVLKRQGSYHLLVPVEKAGEGWVGTIDLSFGRQLLETRLQVVVGWSLRVLTVTAAMGTLLLVLCW